MHAYELAGPALDTLHPVEAPEPGPGRGEVLVRMRAATLNYIDLAVARGGYPVPGWPIIPVADGAGEVAEVGPGVSHLRPGDRVIPHFYPQWAAGRPSPRLLAARRGVTLPGALCEYAVIPADSVVRAPEHLDFVEAAALPIAATTAWRAVTAGEARPGASVLLLGTGGVSLFALQLARAAGARVIITSSSDEKLERARALGADEVVNYRRTPAWDEEVLRLTGGNGADLVVETGGAQTLMRSIKAAAHGATIYTVGFVTGFACELDLLPVISKSLRIQGSNTGSVADFADAVRAVAAHKIRPQIDDVFDVAESRRAYDRLAEPGAHFGKIGISHASWR